MELDLRSLRSFAEVADGLSFTKAAARLGVSQPQLSMRIRALEARLGFPLFERSSRSVNLTRQGAQLLTEAHQMLGQAEHFSSAVQSIRFDIRNTLHLGAIDYFRPLRRRMLGQFTACNPAATVEVELIRLTSDGFSGLASGRLDAAIMLETQAAPPEFETLLLARSTVGLLLPVGSPLTRNPLLSPGDLQDLPVALFRRDTSPALHDEMVRLVEPWGARIVRLPEPTEAGLIEFVRETGTAAICGRWWDDDADEPAGVTHRLLLGHSFELSCVLARPRTGASKACNQLWDLARTVSCAAGNSHSAPL